MKSILCVDDTASNLFTLKNVLQSDQNNTYNIVEASSVKEALTVLLTTPIDLILLDIMMPDIDEFACAKMIKSSKKSRDIPIIFVTAKSDDHTIEHCFETGGVDYVRKPFNQIELLARVQFHLQYHEQSLLIQKERSYVQSILDLQENLILVTDGKRAIRVNQALIDFFDYKDIESFRSNEICLASSFIKREDSFHMGLVPNDVCWIDTLLSHLKDKEQYVLLKKEEHRHIFTINAKRFFEYYLVTLTDVTEMSERSKMYEHDATYDPLTQIYNRNMFDMVMADLMKSRTNFSLILIDIDHFKVVNDTYGHLVGDEVLKMLTTLIKRHIREDDLFTRWGGEEFILSLKVGVTKAMQIAELLRTTIEKEHFSKVGTVHCSFGVTTRDAKSDLKTLFEKADKALYEAKNSGRNRVCQCL